MTTEPKDVLGGDEAKRSALSPSDHDLVDGCRRYGGFCKRCGYRKCQLRAEERKNTAPKASDPLPVREAVAWRYHHHTQPGVWQATADEPGDDPYLVVQPLYADPLPVSREAVARIIEPTAWTAKDVNPDWSVIALRRKVSAPEAVRMSLAKADAILALTGETSRE